MTSFKELRDPSERLAEVAEMAGVELPVAQQMMVQAERGVGAGIMGYQQQQQRYEQQ